METEENTTKEELTTEIDESLPKPKKRSKEEIKKDKRRAKRKKYMKNKKAKKVEQKEQEKNAAREARRAAAKERTVESTTSWNSLYDTKTDENAPKANSSLFSFNFDSKQIEEAHDDENDAFVHPQLKRESVDQTNTQNESQANDDVIIEENPFAGIKLSEVPFTISPEEFTFTRFYSKTELKKRYDERYHFHSRLYKEKLKYYERRSKQ